MIRRRGGYVPRQNGSPRHWLFSHEHYERRFDSYKFFSSFLFFVISFLISFFVYVQIEFFNKLNLLFVRFGSFLLVLGFYFCIIFLYFVFREGKKKYHNLKKGYRLVIISLILVFLVIVLFNQSSVLMGFENLGERIDFNNFNVFSVSEKVSGFDVVDLSIFGVSYDLREVVNFLPLPFGFLILWAVLIGILLILIVRFVYHSELPRPFFWLIIFFFFVMVFMYKVPYDSVEVSGIGSCDYRGNLVFDLDYDFYSPCDYYRSSECRPTCLDKKTVCQCEATLFDFTFRRKGDMLVVLP